MRKNDGRDVRPLSVCCEWRRKKVNWGEKRVLLEEVRSLRAYQQNSGLGFVLFGRNLYKCCVGSINRFQSGDHKTLREKGRGSLLKKAVTRREGMTGLENAGIIEDCREV